MSRRPLWVVVVTLALVAGCTHPQDSRTRAITVAGYVAPWDARSRAELDRPPQPLTEVSPVWYRPTDTGDIVFASNDAMGSSGRPGTQPAGARLVPSVSNFRDGRWDADLISALLRDPARRARHLAALVALARSDGVAGIDLDYESLKPADRAPYTAFIRDLASAVHRAGRRLAVTVHAKTSEAGGSAGARSQDWRALGAVVDELRIMAYDHSWPGSPPGPVAPSAWVEQVLAFAVKQAPPDKILLGVPTYGYDWARTGTGKELDWDAATALASRHRADVRWDEASRSPWFSYQDDKGVDHTVWFEDARSMAAKLALMRKYALGGVVVWRLGGEDPGIWGELHAVA